MKSNKEQSSASLCSDGSSTTEHLKRCNLLSLMWNSVFNKISVTHHWTAEAGKRLPIWYTGPHFSPRLCKERSKQYKGTAGRGYEAAMEDNATVDQPSRNRRCSSGKHNVQELD